MAWQNFFAILAPFRTRAVWQPLFGRHVAATAWPPCGGAAARPPCGSAQVSPRVPLGLGLGFKPD